MTFTFMKKKTTKRSVSFLFSIFEEIEKAWLHLVQYQNCNITETNTVCKTASTLFGGELKTRASDTSKVALMKRTWQKT